MKKLIYSMMIGSYITAFIAIWISANQLENLNLERWKVMYYTAIICWMLAILLSNTKLFFKMQYTK